MAYADFLLGEASAAAAALERCYIVTSGGPTATGGAGTTADGWDDAIPGSTNDATLTDTAGPILTADDGDGRPCVTFSDQNGHNFASFTTGAEYTVALGVVISSISGFRCWYRGEGGSATGTVYTSGGRIFIEDASGTVDTGVDVAVSTAWRRLCIFAGAANYQIAIDGVVVFTGAAVPNGTPNLCSHAYGGGVNGPWTGEGRVYGAYSEDKRADLAALDAAILSEVEVTAPGIELDAAASTTAAGDLAAPPPPLSLDAAASTTTAGQLGADAPGVTLEPAASTTTAGEATAGTAIPALELDAAASTTTAGEAISGEVLDNDFSFVTANPGDNLKDPSTGITDQQLDGRWVASHPASSGDSTSWFNALHGALRWRWRTGPFAVWIRNLRMGTSPANTQTYPTATVAGRIAFAMVQVNADPIGDPTGQLFQIGAGQRGNVGDFGPDTGGITVEPKVTITNISAQSDEGADAIAPDGAIDVLLVKDGAGTLTAFWQLAGTTPDNPTQITMPQALGALPDTVAVGLSVYAHGYFGGAFVGSADAIEETVAPGAVILDSAASTTVTGDLAVDPPALTLAAASTSTAAGELDVAAPAVQAEPAASTTTAGAAAVPPPPMQLDAAASVTTAGDLALVTTLPPIELDEASCVSTAGELAVPPPAVVLTGAASATIAGLLATAATAPPVVGRATSAPGGYYMTLRRP